MYIGWRRPGPAFLLAALVASLCAGLAHAQVEGTDCGCTQTGDYVLPDAGVRPALGTLDATASVITSPGGKWRLERQGPPGPATPAWTVVRVAGGAIVHPGILANNFAWSPDDDRLYTSYQFGSLGAEVQEHKLWDLAAPGGATGLWTSPSASWGSARTRFSADGTGFLFAGARNGNEITLAVVDIPTGAIHAPGPFPVGTLPADIDGDLPENVGAGETGIAGWGWGPDASRFTYAWRTGNGPDEFAQVLVDVRSGEAFGTTRNNPSAKWGFSPCGDVFGLVLKQFFNLDPVTAVLYETRRPTRPQLGQQTFAFDTVELGTSASSHFGLLGGQSTPIATNTAADACPAANLPPAASFAPPPAPIAGQPAAFTDTSSDTDGRVVAWRWDFGDGAASSARNPSHVYATAGRYTVRLTVTDDDGATDFTEIEVLVCGSLGDLSGKVLYSVDAGLYGNGFNRDLYAYDAATSANVQITDSDWCRTSGTCFAQFGGSGTADGARWSPDGSRIAFAPETFGDNGIWVMDADGRNRRRLTDGSGHNGDFDFHGEPAWSPDGEWIVFENGDFTNGTDATGLYLVRADGTGLVKIPGTTRFNPVADHSPDFFPTIAPSCTGLAPAQRGPACYRIAFIRDPFTQPFGQTIRSVRGDGSAAGVLVSEAGAYTLVRVSPDGTRLAIARERIVAGTSDRGIYALRLDDPSAEQVRLTPLEQWAEFPAWSPDGAAVAYRGRDLAAPSVEYDLYVTDPLGCSASMLRSEPGVEERPQDWRPGSAVQGPVSLGGRVTVGDLVTGLGGIVLALSGDATATATSAADGSFVFDGLPAGGSFQLRVVSAPGFVFDPAPVPIELGGSAVGASVLLFPDVATIQGTVRVDGAPLEGIVIRAEGAGGPFEATTDSDGRFTLTTRRDQTYTLSGHKPGFGLDPTTQSVWVGTTLVVDLVAIAVAEIPPGRVAFTKDEGSNAEIYLLDLATGAQTDLTNDPASDRDPAWSPDGTRIAFTSTRDGYPEIFLMDADGANASGTGIYGFEPAWSADGAWLAYATGFGIEMHDMTTGSSWTATFDPSDRGPRWRTDGSQRIVFERTVDVNGEFESDLFEVDVSDLVNPSEMPLVEQPGDDLDPAFSAADGTAFAYASADGDAANDVGIRTMLLSGSDRASPGRNPSWSPDGRFVVYDDAGTLWLFEPGSGNAPIAVTDGGGTASDSDPDWQPVAGGACANGLDDDGDGYVDAEDWGCQGAADPDETRADAACDNGLDDDGDGLVDMADPGCPFPFASPEDPLCDNGLDDDGDGLVDADDPVCQPEWPYWERPPACGLGGEFVLLYGALRPLVRRRRGTPREQAIESRRRVCRESDPVRRGSGA